MRFVPVTAARARRASAVSRRGGIRLRCLTPDDAPHVADLHERLSPDSRYQRYFRLVSSLSPAELARLVAVGPGHLAVGAFDGDALVGVAQYFRSATDPNRAEVAVEVADSHHRRGVGARLVRELARLAAGAGITHFTATVLAENRPVLALIRHSGGDVSTTLDGPYTDVVVTLPAGLVHQVGCREARQAAGPASLPGGQGVSVLGRLTSRRTSLRTRPACS
jgi:GNAT superfamily N-acetyltransferase